jgi:hypothetical protein
MPNADRRSDGRNERRRVRATKARLAAGTAVLAALGTVVGTSALPAGASINATASSKAAALYKEAMATTTSWTVHYASDGVISGVPILESGDAGPTAGTQEVLVGKGPTTDNASLIVIGDLTYLRGNVVALEDLAGLSPAVAANDVNQWVLFATDNPAYSQVVAGVRSHDVAEEIAMNGPFTLGHTRQLDGYEVDAIRGTQKLQGLKRMDAILYVMAHGRHRVVEEDIVNKNGKPTGVEHIIFSKWGEQVKPSAPSSAIPLGVISAT